MKWVVLHTLGDNLLPFGYHNSIKIAYALNIQVVTIGIGEHLFNLEEDSKHYTFEAKMRLLLDLCPESEYDGYREGIERIKAFNKLRNKPSQLIVAFTKLKTTLLSIYDEGSSLFFETIQISHEIRTLKKILEPDTFYYYPRALLTDEIETGFFKLEFPDPEKGLPLFFLTIHDQTNNELLADKIFRAADKEAEKLENSYAEESCGFPFMLFNPENELRSIREELEQPSREFRTKIEAWAQWCYKHPNTNEGLMYFRKHLKKWLSGTKTLPSKSKTLKKLGTAKSSLKSQIWIGEMPIQKVWELFYNCQTIDKEFFDSLLELKSEQSPKYHGRWPVIIYKYLDPNHLFLNPNAEEKNEEVRLSVRKTISLD